MSEINQFDSTGGRSGRVHSPPDFQSEDEEDVELNPHMSHNNDVFNDTAKIFDDKFLEIGEQMKDLATRVSHFSFLFYGGVSTGMYG